MTPYLPQCLYLRFYFASRGPETKSVAYFLHRPAFSASYPPDVNHRHLPSGIFFCEADVVPFRDGIHKNIASRYRSNTSSCSELNGKHASESCMSLRLIVFEIWACKVEKLPILRKYWEYRALARPLNMFQNQRNFHPSFNLIHRTKNWASVVTF